MSILSPHIIVSPNYIVKKPFSTYPLYVNIAIDKEHNDNYFTQKQMTKYIQERILNKWIYTEYMKEVVKMLKVSGEHVTISKNSDIGSKEDIKKKAEYLKETFLDIHHTRKILNHIIEELGYRWYNLLSHERVIVEYTSRYLKKKLLEK